MWGGSYRKPKPAPPREPQAPAVFPPGMRLGPGTVVPTGYPPGYRPPWLNRERPAYAIGAGETYLD